VAYFAVCGENLPESDSLTGVLFVLVGPAGVGKNTIMKHVMEKLPILRQLPTVTTRAMRPGEQEGREHFFVSPDQFQKIKASNGLIEDQEVYPGMFYGTPRQQLNEALRNGEKLIADIEVVGAARLHHAFPDNTVRIFVAPPTLADLEVRLRQRGNMSEEELHHRLKRAKDEMVYADKCDYRITNDNLEYSVDAVVNIISQELLKQEHA
jgi:guanylate kinase